MTARHPKLAAAVRDIALTRGDFTLVSGKKSTYYLDGKLVSCDPQGALLIADAILDEVKNLDIDAIGGMDMGATPIVGAVALRSFQRGRPMPTFIVRKEAKKHGTKKPIEGRIPQPPAKVVVVDDVVTAGGSILSAIDAVLDHGCEVVLAISVVDREEGGAEKLQERGIAYQPLVTITDLGIHDRQNTR